LWGYRPHISIKPGKEAGLEVNTGKTGCMLLSHHQNAKQNLAKDSKQTSETVAQYKYLEMTVTNQI
jgi:hypothetical protein